MKRFWIVCVALMLVLAFTGCESEPGETTPKTDAFTAAAKLAVEKNDALMEAVVSAEKLLVEEKGVLDESLVDAFKNALTAAKDAKVTIPERPATEAEIADAIAQMNAIDYTAVLADLAAARSALEENEKLYALVNNPDSAYIIACLEKVPTVMEIAAATPENDPNGGLNQPNSYTAQVFFTSEMVDQNAIYGTTPMEKGTVGGGSVEVYATVKDAEERDIQLSYFDERTFATGSHTVIGTVVVRTSVNLLPEQQAQLEADILAALLGEEVQ